jgi:hypothetical protein
LFANWYVTCINAKIILKTGKPNKNHTFFTFGAQNRWGSSLNDGSPMPGANQD